jgi:anaerobic selenocysteine-containing dehydrogenase
MDANNLIIIWGGNPIGFTRPARLTHMFLDAQERGAKIVHISNLFDNTSAKADEWVPVHSGTDAALALGMANVIIAEGKVNQDFMLAETAAAILVRNDTGRYLRESDVVEGGDANKFGIFDKKSNSVVFIPRVAARPAAGGGKVTVGGGAGAETVVQAQDVRSSIYGAYEPQMDCEATAGGIACKTSYRLLVEHLQNWTPEAAEKVCGVAASTIRHLANLYADSTPSLICIGDGLRYRNGTQSLRAVKLLTYLTGNHGAPNGGTIMSAGIDDVEMTMFDRSNISYVPELTQNNADFAFIDDVLASHTDASKQQYKVLLCVEGNPLLNWPNKKFWHEDMLPFFDLVVSVEIRMTDTCRWSDYVLPEATVFERAEIVPDLDNNLVYSEPAIAPRGESRTAADIWNGIASRTGCGEYFDKTQEQWVQYMIDHQPAPLQAPLSAAEDQAHAGEMAPITFERLQKHPVIHLRDTQQDDVSDPYATSPLYFTETGLIQFYSEIHADIGYALADFEQTYVTDPKLKEQYPLHLFIARHKFFMQGQFTNVPEMESLAHRQFGVALNPVDAKKRGLRDGDPVEVFNERGVMRSVLQLREDVAPGIAHTWYSFDETYYPDTDCPQVLASPQNHPSTATPMSPINGDKWLSTQVTLGAPPVGRFIAGQTTPEVIFDQVCDVRKAA